MPTIEIDGRTSGLTFAYAHIVPGHPKCGRLHGHSGAVILRFTGPIGDKNMVIDFGVLKAAARRVTERIDHRTILGLLQEGLHVEDFSSYFYVAAKRVPPLDRPDKEYRIAVEDVALLSDATCTAEGLAVWFRERLWEELRAEDIPPEATIDVGWCEGPANIAWSGPSERGVD